MRLRDVIGDPAAIASPAWPNRNISVSNRKHKAAAIQRAITSACFDRNPLTPAHPQTSTPLPGLRQAGQLSRARNSTNLPPVAEPRFANAAPSHHIPSVGWREKGVVAQPPPALSGDYRRAAGTAVPELLPPALPGVEPCRASRSAASLACNFKKKRKIPLLHRSS